LQLEARLFHLPLPDDAFERHRDGFDWCDETSIAYLSAMHRTNAPPPARALTISRTFFGKVEIHLDAARLKSVTSSLHSPLDEGTAIPASQPTAGTPFSLQLAGKQSRLNGNVCSDLAARARPGSHR
jgi:hypothetical protein